jgi:hypothetical protein
VGYQTPQDVVLRGIRPRRTSVRYKMYTTLPCSAGSDTPQDLVPLGLIPGTPQDFVLRGMRPCWQINVKANRKELSGAKNRQKPFRPVLKLKTTISQVG